MVLDASAAIAAVVGRDEASGILALLEDATVVLAPDLYPSEVTNTMWKYVAFGGLAVDDAVVSLQSALELVDRMIPVAHLSQEVLREAARYGHPAYDLCYAVAARREAASVLTIDRKLAKLLSRMKIPVVGPGRRGRA